MAGVSEIKMVAVSKKGVGFLISMGFYGDLRRALRVSALGEEPRIIQAAVGCVSIDFALMGQQ